MAQLAPPALNALAREEQVLAAASGVLLQVWMVQSLAAETLAAVEAADVVLAVDGVRRTHDKVQGLHRELSKHCEPGEVVVYTSAVEAADEVAAAVRALVVRRFGEHVQVEAGLWRFVDEAGGVGMVEFVDSVDEAGMGEALSEAAAAAGGAVAAAVETFGSGTVARYTATETGASVVLVSESPGVVSSLALLLAVVRFAESIPPLHAQVLVPVVSCLNAVVAANVLAIVEDLDLRREALRVASNVAMLWSSQIEQLAREQRPGEGLDLRLVQNQTEAVLVQMAEERLQRQALERLREYLLGLGEEDFQASGDGGGTEEAAAEEEDGWDWKDDELELDEPVLATAVPARILSIVGPRPSAALVSLVLVYCERVYPSLALLHTDLSQLAMLLGGSAAVETHCQQIKNRFYRSQFHDVEEALARVDFASLAQNPRNPGLLKTVGLQFGARVHQAASAWPGVGTEMGNAFAAGVQQAVVAGVVGMEHMLEADLVRAAALATEVAAVATPAAAKTAVLARLVTVSLAGVMEMLHNSDLYQFSTSELVRVVRARFPEGAVRADCIAEIHEIRTAM